MRRIAAFALCLALAAPLALHAQTSSGFEPRVGQDGKDVIWVPTPDALVSRMLRMARVTPSDFVIDLGSGDGKIAIAAARDFKAKSRGIEYNPEMVALSRRNAEAAGVTDRVEFIRGDLFEQKLEDATVITMYLLSSLNLKLRPRLLELKPGTRIVSHAFDLGDWKPDETAMVEGRSGFLWIVPAGVDGTWRVEHPGRAGKETFELVIKQRYQMMEGNARRGNRIAPLSGSLQGERIRFSFPDEGFERVYVGRVVDDRIEGRVRTQGGTEVNFTATRN